MEWVLLFVGTILAAEVLLHAGLKEHVGLILDFTRRSGATISSSRISDHWKEKALVHYAVKIFIHSIRLLISLLLIAAPLIAAHFLGVFFKIDLMALLITPVGMLASLAVATGYVFIRIKVLHG